MHAAGGCPGGLAAPRALQVSCTCPGFVLTAEAGRLHQNGALPNFSSPAVVFPVSCGLQVHPGGTCIPVHGCHGSGQLRQPADSVQGAGGKLADVHRPVAPPFLPSLHLCRRGCDAGHCVDADILMAPAASAGRCCGAESTAHAGCWTTLQCSNPESNSIAVFCFTRNAL